MSSSTTSTPEVLIVGSGPSGLILALSLARTGVPVRVIEKTKINRIGQRGAGLTPRSLELFESLGIIDEVIKRYIPFPMLRMYKMPEGVEVLKEFWASPNLDPTPSNPYLNLTLLGQDNLDKIIRAELEKLGCTVELGVELQSLEQFEDRVDVKLLKHNLEDEAAETVAEEASYKWVVGADGAKGVVRKQLGLSFLGETSEENFVIGDIKLEGLRRDRWHMWGEAANVLTSIRPTETAGLFCFIVGGSKLGNHAEICASDEALKQFLKKGTGNRGDIKYGEVVCMAHYRINVRMVDKFQKGRVFVIGDAGHVHSPAGGQGMNTGIQDSFNLGWKLALVTKGLAPPSLLESFSEERLPIVAEMLNITSSLMKKTIANTSSEEGWNRSGNINQLGVNYRGSPIVLDEEEETHGEAKTKGSSYAVEVDGAVHAGDRAPDAPGLVKLGVGNEPTRLFKLFRPTRHTILIFADKVDYKPVLASLEKQPMGLVHPVVISKAGTSSGIIGIDIFEDRDGHAYNAYKGPEGTTGIFAIRPDGVIGCRVGNTTGLERYFKGIFGNQRA